MPTGIIDTVVLIAFSNENDPLNEKASEYMFEVGIRGDLLVPSATLLEFDLELKTHGVEGKDREKLHSSLKRLIPTNRVLPLTPSVLERASQLSPKANWRGAYFDALIVATGLDAGAASAVSTDRRFTKLGLPPHSERDKFLHTPRASSKNFQNQTTLRPGFDCVFVFLDFRVLAGLTPREVNIR